MSDVWNAVLIEALKYLPQLIVTFIGVFLAFMLDRLIEYRKRNQDKKDVLRDLRSELEGIRDKLGKEYYTFLIFGIQ